MLYREGIVLLLGVFVLTLAAHFADKKVVSRVGNEGLTGDIDRDRRGISKSPIKVGRSVDRVERHVGKLRLGFFTEIHCRRLQHWLNNGGHEYKIRDCQDVQTYGGKKSGVYTIHPKGGKKLKVYCDMKTDGGGWTVFQHRYDGSLNFYRRWADYKTGFGNPSKEFWLGNENIHIISSQSEYKLRINLEDTSGSKKYAEYSRFVLGNESQRYRLHIGSYSGNAGDSLSYHNGMMFSTQDRDNDIDNRKCCAVLHKGSWWYRGCDDSNLNGLYSTRKTSAEQYNVWQHWKGGQTNMKSSTMMIRRI